MLNKLSQSKTASDNKLINTEFKANESVDTQKANLHNISSQSKKKT